MTRREKLSSEFWASGNRQNANFWLASAGSDRRDLMAGAAGGCAGAETQIAAGGGAGDIEDKGKTQST